MARWVVLVDKTDKGKRLVKIEDTQSRISYKNYFPLNASNSVILNRFKAHVKESRDFDIPKPVSTLDLTTFEAGL